MGLKHEAKKGTVIEANGVRIVVLRGNPQLEITTDDPNAAITTTDPESDLRDRVSKAANRSCSDDSFGRTVSACR